MKTKLYILALALVGISLNSCDKFLTPDNKKTGGETAEKFFSKDPASLRTYAYSLMKPVVSRTDVSIKGTDLYMMAHGKSESQFQSYVLTSENADVKKFYQDCYAAINAANAIMYYDEAGLYTADALFIRSYMYYLLSQQFGPVPFVGEYINNSERNYPRMGLADLYGHIIDDLTAVYGSASSVEDHNGYASKRAAAALLAKVYLAAGWDLQTTLVSAEQGTYTVTGKSYFDAAVKWANTAIDDLGTVHDLESLTNEQKWSPALDNNNVEEIFSVQYSLAGYPGEASTGGHGLQNHFGSFYDNPSKTGGKYSDSEDAPTLKAALMWEKGDARFESTFMTTWVGHGDNADEGYFLYYKDPAKYAQAKIWLQYYPWYMTDAEVAADLAAKKDRFAQDETYLTCQAFHMGSKFVTYSFDKDGNATRKNSTNEYMTDVYANSYYAPTVKKWDDPNTLMATSSSNCFRDIVLLHLSETFLTAAEAHLMAGEDTKALKRLNAVRHRAGLADLTSFESYDPEYATKALRPIDVILDERAKELYGEPGRWEDLRRTKQLIHYNVEYSYYIDNAAKMANGAGEYKWYRPIPQAEINANTALTNADQNPGY